MKDYYLFPTKGNPLQIEIDGNIFTVCLKDDIEFEVLNDGDVLKVQTKRVRTSFTKDELIKQLETFLSHAKKKV